MIVLSCCLSAFGATLPVLGQAPAKTDDEYLQTSWTTEDGLPQNSVNAILQTRDGYLWLATFGGLARFDGVKFTIFNTGNTPGLKSNRILSLCEGADGTLWLGAETGDVMRFKDGAGQTYTKNDGLPGGYVWAIKEDKTGALWAGTSRGLARFRDNRFVVYTSREGFPDEGIWAINEDAAGSLWFATDRALVERRGGEFIAHRLPADIVQGSWVYSAVRRGGGLWLGTRSSVTSFDDGNFIPHPNADAAPDWEIRTFMEDREGTLWISYLSPNRIYRFKDGVFSVYALDSGHRVIRSMYEDREGNLWMGSDGSGLIRLKKRRLTTYSSANGLPGDGVRAITDDGAGGVWVATDSGLVHWQAGRFRTYTQRDGMLSYDLSALCRDSRGSLWIGSNYGLTQLKDGRFINYTAAQGLTNPNVHSLAEDSAGTLWVGTEGGLHELRDDGLRVFRHPDGAAYDDVRFIMQARDGALWLGTTGGLSRFKDGAFTTYTTRQGLSNDYVRAIFEEPDGTLWLGTYGGGLVRFREGRFISVTTEDGLFDDFISRILEDEQGRFWLLGNRGVFRANRRELNDLADGRINFISSVSYGIADGMLNSEGNGGFQPAGWRTADGKLWFPTIKGMVRIEPQEGDTMPPPVRIEQVSIDRAALPANGIMRIEPGQENLEIAYTGLSFSRPEQVKFRYRLTGLDERWVDAGNRRTAYYTHLPPGAYTFEVVADNDGVWSERAATISIVVRPPFWRTWWFVSLCLMCVGGAVLAGFRLRVGQLKRRHKAQEEFSRRLINAHESERRRIAAELHDGLGQSLAMIKNTSVFGAQAANDLEAAKEHLANITAQSAQAIGEVREIAYNLRPYLLDRLGLTKAVKSLLNKVAESGTLKLTADVDDVDGLFSAEAEMSIYRIIQESLNNILKHADATEAEISVKRRDRAVLITIRDDGKGFNASAPGDGDGSGRGFGLLGMSERVRMLGGTRSIQSDSTNGTTIVINLGKNRNRATVAGDTDIAQ